MYELLESVESIVLALSPAQTSAVEIYLLDDAHEEEFWFGKISLKGHKLTINMSREDALEMFLDAINSADAGDGRNPDSVSVKSLSALHSKLRTGMNTATSKTTKAAKTANGSKLKSLRKNILDRHGNRTGAIILLNPADYRTWASEDGKNPEGASFEIQLRGNTLKFYPNDSVRPNEYKAL
jgi:hypothetical protein